MPDTALTWANLREHLRKFGLIYLVVIAVALAAGNLLWITTQPRVPESRRVLVYLADKWSDPAPLEGIAQRTLERLQSEGAPVDEVAFESLMYNDEDYTGIILLTTRLAVGEGDAFLAGPSAMQALVNARACLPLEDRLADGWMDGLDPQPYYDDVPVDDTGNTRRTLVGLSLDGLDALGDMEAFHNAGACLALADNGGNVDTTLRALEIIVEMLREGGGAHA